MIRNNLNLASVEVLIYKSAKKSRIYVREASKHRSHLNKFARNVGLQRKRSAESSKSSKFYQSCTKARWKGQRRKGKLPLKSLPSVEVATVGAAVALLNMRLLAIPDTCRNIGLKHKKEAVRHLCVKKTLRKTFHPYPPVKPFFPRYPTADTNYPSDIKKMFWYRTFLNVVYRRIYI